jgi:hypothetical protein
MPELLATRSHSPAENLLRCIETSEPAVDEHRLTACPNLFDGG